MIDVVKQCTWASSVVVEVSDDQSGLVYEAQLPTYTAGREKIRKVTGTYFSGTEYLVPTSSLTDTGGLGRRGREYIIVLYNYAYRQGGGTEKWAQLKVRVQR